MTPGGKFNDDYEESLREALDMSDAELERLLGGAEPEKSPEFEQLEPGTILEGVVVEVQSQEILLELDRKTLGVVDLEEYAGDELPSAGTALKAEFVRYDSGRSVCVLTTKAVRTEIAWEELRVGMVLEGIVDETNRGGLTLSIKGMRAFMPISQIELGRVEDLEPYVGRKLRCEVTQVDRAERNLVVSRRRVLDRESESERRELFDKLQEGEVIRGKVTRMTEHGAFVDVGGIDGLLHISKIVQRRETLEAGDLVEVEIVRLDRDRGRVALDFRSVDELSWDSLVEGYEVGDNVTGWIARVENTGEVILALGEGLEAVIPKGLAGEAEVGNLVRGTIASIDSERNRVEVVLEA